jgi:hypothetical protein
MAAYVGVVASDVLVENGVFLPLKSIEEVEQFAEKLENDIDCRNQLVCVVLTSPYKNVFNHFFKLLIL